MHHCTTPLKQVRERPKWDGLFLSFLLQMLVCVSRVLGYRSVKTFVSSHLDYLVAEWLSQRQSDDRYTLGSFPFTLLDHETVKDFYKWANKQFFDPSCPSDVNTPVSGWFLVAVHLPSMFCPAFFSKFWKVWKWHKPSPSVQERLVITSFCPIAAPPTRCWSLTWSSWMTLSRWSPSAGLLRRTGERCWLTASQRSWSTSCHTSRLARMRR